MKGVSARMRWLIPAVKEPKPCRIDENRKQQHLWIHDAGSRHCVILASVASGRLLVIHL